MTTENPTPVQPDGAPSPRRLTAIAEFHSGVMTWGRLRAIAAIAANGDDERIRFDTLTDGTDPLQSIVGIYVEIDAP